MKRSKKRDRLVVGVAIFCLLGVWAVTASIAFGTPVDLRDFDHQGKKIYDAHAETPQPYMSADSGDRNLATYYERRQYPGSPPVIPHEIDQTFSGDENNCLSCHAKGGYSQEFDKFVPVTPHPENKLCYQCHAKVTTTKKFVEIDWKSIKAPRLGRSFLSSSPPPIPHALQMRENCIACHTGPGAVVEIRVDHSARGNCRQCHVPAVQTTPVQEFVRKP